MPDPFLELFKETLLGSLDETFSRVRGIYLDKGTSLFETLATVSAEEASCSLSSDSATIAAQVEHVRFFLDVVNDSMQRGAYEKVDWKEIWRTVRAVTPQQWDAARRRLHESHERVLATMTTYDRWESPFRYRVRPGSAGSHGLSPR
jgi:hypothetical protein